MGQIGVAGIDELVGRLSQAVQLGAPERVTRQVKQDLEDLVRREAVRLPDPYRRCRTECYARRLLHRDTVHGYTVVLMTWGPGQHTQLHDHAGIWCVECVVEGELNVIQYDLAARDGDRYQFVERSDLLAGVGDAGCLIPPSEYHVMRNPRRDRTAISLHVYGGEMSRCNLYVPTVGGWWEKRSKRLEYDN
jgi:predicted metal-dependent enzyme (double-stranded beta helix superfamily)